jgi:hypothetical protein
MRKTGSAAFAQPPAPTERRRLSRGLIFGLLMAACLAFAAGYVAWARLRMQPAAPIAATLPATAAPVSAAGAARPAPAVIFRSTALDAFGTVATVPLGTPNQPRAITKLNCDRVYFAGGQGVCLTADRGVITTYSAVFSGGDFKPRRTIPLEGIPSRTRVSPDGRYASITVFVSGHSYSPGSFSTLTTLYDLRSDTSLGDLEQFAVERNGAPFSAVDFNFWGVTFARDSQRFYATLASGGIAYLVEGNLETRRARVLYERVECPSLSPDNQRVAFKRLTSDHGWQLYVLDLDTLIERPLGETRSVDDQVEWLDDNHLLYGLSDDSTSATPGENVWILPIDGSAGPRIFQPMASSPAVVH